MSLPELAMNTNLKEAQLKHFLITGVSALALTVAATAASAECQIGSATGYTKADRGVASADMRRDLRSLREAAMILKQRNQEEACQQIVSVIDNMRKKGAMSGDQSGDQAANKDGMKDGQKAAGNNNTGDTRAANRQAGNRAGSGYDMTWQERSKQRMADAKPLDQAKGQLAASNLIGADVIGTGNDTIAEVNDVVMEPNGKAAYLVVGFGGFLGLGEDQAAIPFERLKVAYDNNGNATFYLGMTEEQLSQAPKFKRGTVDWVSDDNWRKKNDAFYQKTAGMNDNKPDNMKNAPKKESK